MFTGIIQELGVIKAIEKAKDLTRFEVEAKSIIKDKKIGDSIAVNGACVTVTKLSKKGFSFDAINETIKLTNFKEFKEGSEVNLEAALKFNQSLDGHLVQGHVDTEGTVVKTGKTLSIRFPKELAQFLAYKGSITINGVSLTITDLQHDFFSVELIPHTLENTNLKNLKDEDKVNLEVDMIARYLHRMLGEKEKESKYHFLKERNLI